VFLDLLTFFMDSSHVMNMVFFLTIAFVDVGPTIRLTHCFIGSQYLGSNYGLRSLCQYTLCKTEELEGLLSQADKDLNPSWEYVGLFYPRNDEQDSATEGKWTHMDPFSGNAEIGYARLNVPDGQRIMWERPWTREDLAGRPCIDGVGLGSGVDCLRGAWDEVRKALVLTVRTWDGKVVVLWPVARNLARGQWPVYVDRELREVNEVG
jgi:hypothetical protein